MSFGIIESRWSRGFRYDIPSKSIARLLLVAALNGNAAVSGWRVDVSTRGHQRHAGLMPQQVALPRRKESRSLINDIVLLERSGINVDGQSDQESEERMHAENHPSSSQPETKLPSIAVVGAPNVGKSSIVNWITASKISMVFHESGITRDNIYGTGSWEGRKFTVIDTGGYGYVEEDKFDDVIRKQSLKGIDEASVILFVVDGIQGLTQQDEEVADIVRKSGKPCVLAVNKCDFEEDDDMNTADFWVLGLGTPMPICAEDSEMVRMNQLMYEITSLLPAQIQDHDREDVVTEAHVNEIRVAILGQPNVGKSSLINQLLGEERQIVSEVAGCTREAIDHSVYHNDSKFIFVDTAGVRNKTEVVKGVEERMVRRSLAAMRRADACLFVIDGSGGRAGLSRQDGLLARKIAKAKCPCVLVVNKWDLAPKDNSMFQGELEEGIAQRLWTILKFREAPLYIAAKDGVNRTQIFTAIERSVATAAKDQT